MMAAALLFVAGAALLELFVFYCRALLDSYSAIELSPQAREVTGIENRAAGGDEFKRLLQIANMCLEPKGDKARCRSVGAYYGVLNLLRALSAVAPRVADWTERERARCAYFAAVMVDRRIAYTRALWAEQMLDEGR